MNAQPAMHAYTATMAVRRRSAVERRVLAFLRSEDDDGAGPAASQARVYFAVLRRSAAAAGLTVQPPEVPYLSADELRLLGWIAQAQRVMNYTVAMPHDPVLIAAIARCAGLLDAMGLRLGPRTIFAASQKGGHHEA